MKFGNLFPQWLREIVLMCCHFGGLGVWGLFPVDYLCALESTQKAFTANCWETWQICCVARVIGPVDLPPTWSTGSSLQKWINSTWHKFALDAINPCTHCFTLLLQSDCKRELGFFALIGCVTAVLKQRGLLNYPRRDLYAGGAQLGRLTQTSPQSL